MTMVMPAARVFVAVVLLGLLVPASPAFAHSEVTGSKPADGAELDLVPTAVVIDFSEGPTTDSEVRVLDGCGDNLAQEVSISGETVTVPLSEGQPGEWRVRYLAISAVDGHESEAGYGFRVAGTPECTATGADDPDGVSGEGSWLVVALLVLVLIAIIVVLRLLSLPPFNRR